MSGAARAVNLWGPNSFLFKGVLKLGPCDNVPKRTHVVSGAPRTTNLWVPVLLQHCSNTAVLLLWQYCCSTAPLHCCFSTAVILLQPYCYSTASMLFLYCSSAVLLQCCSTLLQQYCSRAAHDSVGILQYYSNNTVSVLRRYCYGRSAS